jgi:PAT family beta-lactamase induction signal transducer AmpG
MAAVMMAGLSAILLSPEPIRVADPPKSLAEAVGAPLREFFSRPQAIGFLAVIVLYKLGDAFASSLQTAFLIGGVGFSVTDVGAAKGIGVFATLFGALIGGVMMTRTGLVPSLLIFGLLQAVSNLGFALLAMVGKSSAMLMTAIVIENVTGGMGTAAFVALVMSLCDPRYTATQFALLSSLEALGRVFAGRPSAEIVDAVGWTQFFVFTLVVALPGIFAVWSLRHRIEQEQKERTPAFSPAA